MKRLMVFGAIALMFTMFVGCQMNTVTPEYYTYEITVSEVAKTTHEVNEEVEFNVTINQTVVSRSLNAGVNYTVVENPNYELVGEPTATSFKVKFTGTGNIDVKVKLNGVAGVEDTVTVNVVEPTPMYTYKITVDTALLEDGDVTIRDDYKYNNSCSVANGYTTYTWVLSQDNLAISEFISSDSLDYYFNDGSIAFVKE